MLSKSKLLPFLLCLISISNECFAFTQPVIFDIQDSSQMPQNTSIATTITIDVNNNIVSITIPSLSFSLPSAHNVIVPPQMYRSLDLPNSPGSPIFPLVVNAGGYVYTKSGFIPEAYRPGSAIGVQATMTSTPSAPAPGMIAVVTQEGNIRIAAPSSGVFPGGTSGYNGPGYYAIQQSGSFTTDSVTISYPLDTTSFSPPTNFALSNGYTQEIYLPYAPIFGQYADTYFGDIYNGFFGSYWADNSTTTAYPYNANGLTRMGTLTSQNIVQMQDPVVAIPVLAGYCCAQGGMAINPTNPDNLVIDAALSSNVEIPTGIFQLWSAASFDGGKTWPIARRIDTPPILANAGSDNNALFDRFGNYWVTNVTFNGTTHEPPFFLSILLSSDGGQTFSAAGVFDPTIPPLNASTDSFLDFNQMAFGGDGNGGYALYFTCVLIDNDPPGSITPCIGYFPVSGNGSANIGTPNITKIASGALEGFCVAGTPIVSNNGDIFINYEGTTNNNSGTYRSLYLFHIPGGINGILDGTYNGPYFTAQTNLCFARESSPGLGTWYSSLNAKNIRGSNPGCAVRGLAYDNNKQALIVLVNDTDPVYSQNGTVYLIISKDAGVTWSAPYHIKDNPLGNALEVSMTLDPVAGDLYVSWYDTRNDQPANQYVEFYGTIVSSEQLTAIIDTL